MATVQLRRYELVDGMVDDFVNWWPNIIEVRQQYGFEVQFGYVDREAQQFVWAVRFDGDLDAFRAAEQVYSASPERAKVFEGQPKRVETLHVSIVEQIY